MFPASPMADQQPPFGPQAASSPEAAEILVADDSAENLFLLGNILKRCGYEVRQVQDGEAALAAVKDKRPDLILLDVVMPGYNGYEVCQRLKLDPDSADIPVIFISTLDAAFDKVKAFGVGGADYVTKPIQIEEFLARIRNQLALRAALQEVRQLNTLLEDRVRDRTSQLAAVNDRLTRLAFHDDLTGLPNRALFLEYIDISLAQARRQTDHHFVVLGLDCDRFRSVNESLGHLVGDRLLVAIARRLSEHLPRTATLARLGGDEFGIMLLGAPDKAAATAEAEAILRAFERPFSLGERQIFTKVSLGIVLGDETYQHTSDVLRDADAALHEAKANGKGRYCWFAPTLRNEALERLNLENDLCQAIARQEFRLVYQPVVDLAAGKVTGFEALLRWHHAQRGVIPPDIFISLAEENGTIVTIGDWVLQQACEQLQYWQQTGLSVDISVNLSVRQLEQPELLAQLDRAITTHAVDPADLKLEITESACLDNSSAMEALEQIKARQLRLSLDDFGTGYSSLSYLHSLPIDTLKIDKSFMQKLDRGRDDRGLIPAIVSMAKALGLSVVAEGVETGAQLDQLRLLDVEFGQGYFFARPLTAAAATELLQTNPCW